MLDWLPFFNKTFPLEAIRLGRHLEAAQTQTAQAFLARQALGTTAIWSILHVDKEVVYWGEINQGTVAKRYFFKTPKEHLEQALRQLSPNQQEGLDQQVLQYLKTYFDRIDGQLIVLQGLQLQTAAITQEGHYQWTYQVDLTVQSTGLQATPQAEKWGYVLWSDGETGAIIRLEKTAE